MSCSSPGAFPFSTIGRSLPCVYYFFPQPSCSTLPLPLLTKKVATIVDDAEGPVITILLLSYF